MNIALYGGSFDPPHIAHFEIIKEVSKTLEIDLLFVMVAYQNPLKQKCLFNEHLRLRWMQMLCEGIDKVIVSDFEIQNKIVFTKDTLIYMQETYNPKKMYWILGEDNVATLHKWKDYETLQKKVEFIFVRREGFEYNADSKSCAKVVLKNIDFPLSSTMLRNNLAMATQKYIPKKILNEVKKNLKEQCLKSQRLDFIIEKLSEKKAEDIECIDVSDKDYIVDFVIIATTMAGRHAFALLDMLKTELKPRGEVFYAVDEESEDWIVMDLGDIMIHLFTENHRKKFNLEEFLKKDLSKRD